MEQNIVFCQGYNCALRSSCKRFVNSPAVLDDVDWMRNCSDVDREYYLEIDK